MTLKIVPVRTKQEREAFIRVPFMLYHADPNWVPPLLFDRRSQIIAVSDGAIRRNGEAVR